MAGHHGAQANKTHRRLKHIMDNFTYFHRIATSLEKDVLTGIKLAGISANTLAIAKKAGVSSSMVNSTIRRFEYFSPSEVSTTDTIIPKLNDIAERQFQHVMDINGATYVLLTEAEDKINKLNVAAKATEAISIVIASVSITKNSIRNTINISLYMKNNDELDLNDLYELLGVGDDIGITVPL